MWIRVETSLAGGSALSKRPSGECTPHTPHGLHFVPVVSGAQGQALICRQAEILESAPAMRAAAQAADKAKLEAIERQLGISSKEGESSSAAAKRAAEVDLTEVAAKKYRFEDAEFLEQSREINDSVRSAVSAGKSEGCPLYECSRG